MGEKVFEVLDEDQSGMIAYEKLQEFMKMGKIPSTIMAKIKATGKSPKRTSIMFGAAPINNIGGLGLKDRVHSPRNKGVGMLPILAESDQSKPNKVEPKEDKMSPERIKMIQRAVIVIKKAAMKNISRDEVVEFLTDKKMSREDIELAYKKAQEKVMSPEERITYLSQLVDSKKKEIEEQKTLNEYLSQKMSVQSQEIETLRECLTVSTDTLFSKFINKSQDVVSQIAAEELTNKIQQATKDVKQAEEQKMIDAAAVHKNDLQTLQKISECITEQRHFHAFLYFHLLDIGTRESMPNLQGFLNDFDVPDDK